LNLTIIVVNGEGEGALLHYAAFVFFEKFQRTPVGEIFFGGEREEALCLRMALYHALL